MVKGIRVTWSGTATGAANACVRTTAAHPRGPVHIAALADSGGPARMSMVGGAGSVVVSLTVGWSLR